MDSSDHIAISEWAQERTPNWMDDAVCASIGGDTWFPEKGGSTREAKRICNGCDVQAECLAYALENDKGVGRYGVWGGLSERERRRMSRRAAAEPVVAEPAAA